MGSTCLGSCLGSPSESEGESVSEEAIQATEEVELSPKVFLRKPFKQQKKPFIRGSHQRDMFSFWGSQSSKRGSLPSEEAINTREDLPVNERIMRRWKLLSR